MDHSLKRFIEGIESGRPNLAGLSLHLNNARVELLSGYNFLLVRERTAYIEQLRLASEIYLTYVEWTKSEQRGKGVRGRALGKT